MCHGLQTLEKTDTNQNGYHKQTDKQNRKYTEDINTRELETEQPKKTGTQHRKPRKCKEHHAEDNLRDELHVFVQ